MPKKLKSTKSKKKAAISKGEEEILKYWQNRLPHYQEMLQILLGMGAPIIHFEPPRAIIEMLKERPTNKELLARALSIMFEGASVEGSKQNLAMVCQRYLGSILGFEPELEIILDIIRDNCIMVEDENEGPAPTLQFDEKFLRCLGQDRLEFTLRFRSISFGNYYELKDLNLLRDYGSVEQFEELRRLRALVSETIKSVQAIIQAIKSLNVLQIDMAVDAYLDLRKYANIPFTIAIVLEEVKYETYDSMDSKETKHQTQDVKADMKIEERLPGRERGQMGIEQFFRKKGDQTKEKGADKSKGLGNEAGSKVKIERGLDDDLAKELKRQNVDAWVRSIKAKQRMQVNKAEYFSEKQDQSKSKQLMTPKRKIYARRITFDVFDSAKTLENFVLRMQYPVYPRRPFHLCTDRFINYEQDSDDDMQSLMGDDIEMTENESESEEMANSCSSRNSLKEFFDQEDYDISRYQDSKVESFKTYKHFLNPQSGDSLEYFKQFEAIGLFDNKVQFKLLEDEKRNKEKIERINGILQFIEGRKGSKQQLQDEYQKLNPDCSKYLFDKLTKENCYKIQNTWFIKESQKLEFLNCGINLFKQ